MQVKNNSTTERNEITRGWEREENLGGHNAVKSTQPIGGGGRADYYGGEQ